ncbi:hypothetical protein [Oceanobacillus sp. CFH 90083]|nr:hypothetical protein [Oceanobacillus sp. CFH 90083]
MEFVVLLTSMVSLTTAVVNLIISIDQIRSSKENSKKKDHRSAKR